MIVKPDHSQNGHWHCSEQLHAVVVAAADAEAGAVSGQLLLQ